LVVQRSKIFINPKYIFVIFFYIKLNSNSSGASRCPIVVAAAVLDSKIQSPSKSA